MYEADEVYAPDKYDISDSIYYFGVGVSRESKTGLKATGAKVIGGSDDDSLEKIVNTDDGGYIVGGTFSENMTLENGFVATSNGKYDIILIKYSSEEEMEWVKTLGGNDSDNITSIIATSDGGYLVGGYSSSQKIDLGNGVIINKSRWTNN